MAKAVLGIEHMLSERPSNPRLRHLMWRVYTLASVIYEEVNDRRSLEFAEKALQAASNSLESEPNDTQARHNLARTTYRLGVLLVNLKQPVAAISKLSQAETMFKSLIEMSPRNNYYRSDLARIYLREGLALQSLGKLDESNRTFDNAMGLWQFISEANPANNNVRRDIALTNMYVGDNWKNMRRSELATERYKSALDIMLQLKNQGARPEIDAPLITKMQSFLAPGR